MLALLGQPWVGGMDLIPVVRELISHVPCGMVKKMKALVTIIIMRKIILCFLCSEIIYILVARGSIPQTVLIQIPDFSLTTVKTVRKKQEKYFPRSQSGGYPRGKERECSW